MNKASLVTFSSPIYKVEPPCSSGALNALLKDSKLILKESANLTAVPAKLLKGKSFALGLACKKFSSILSCSSAELK